MSFDDRTTGLVSATLAPVRRGTDGRIREIERGSAARLGCCAGFESLPRLGLAGLRTPNSPAGMPASFRLDNLKIYVVPEPRMWVLIGLEVPACCGSGGFADGTSSFPRQAAPAWLERPF